MHQRFAAWSGKEGPVAIVTMPLLQILQLFECTTSPLAKIHFAQPFIYLYRQILSICNNSSRLRSSLDRTGIHGVELHSIPQMKTGRLRLAQTLGIQRNAGDSATQLDANKVSVTVTDE